MWSNFSDVTKKLKDIAIELAQPHYDNDDYDQGQQVGSGEETKSGQPQRGSLQTSHGYGSVPAGYQGSSRLRTSTSGGPVEPPTRRPAASSDFTLTPPLCQPQSSTVSGAGFDGGTVGAGDVMDQNALKLSLKGGDMRPVGTSSAMDLHNHEGRISELLLQVQHISEEKEQLERQLARHKEEVAEANRETLRCYEQKIALLQTELASQKKQKSELEEKLAFYVQECDKLHQEVERLKEREKTLTNKTQITKEVEAEGGKLLATRDKECMKVLHHIKSLEGVRGDLLEQAKDDVLMNSFSAVCTGAPINNNNIVAMATDGEDLKELNDRIITLEQENLAILRQKEEINFLLRKSFVLLCASFDEREDVLNLSYDQIQLFTEFIQKSNNELQQMREEEGRKIDKIRCSSEQYASGEEIERTAVIMTEKNEQKVKATASILEKLAITTQETQFDLVEHGNEDVIQHIPLDLEKYKNSVAITSSATGYNKQECSDIVEKLLRELHNAEKQLSESKKEQTALQREAQELKKCVVDSQLEVKKLSEKLILADERVAQLELTLAEAQRAVEGCDPSFVRALTKRKKELEVECTQKNELMQQLEHIVSDCIVRANIELPQSRDTGVCASFSDKLTLLASEFNRFFDGAKNSERREKEWGRTYEQARSVNETLTQQVSEAWKTIGKLQEELSLRDQSLDRLNKQLQIEVQQHLETQRQLTSVMNELQALKEDKGMMGVSDGGSCAVGTLQERLTTMRADVDTLRRVLQEREDELAQSQRGMETLQEVLDTFTRNKARDVEERTAELQLEIDQLREQLSLVEERRQRHQDEIDKLNMSHLQEIAAKNLELKALHRKHAELRNALEETAQQLNGSMLIDKRVISHIIVNFIHAFVGQRPEADEILKVLSGLLNWDEATQEKAGLLPGPTNPKVGQQRRSGGLIGGIVSTVWGSPGHKKLKYDSKSCASPSIAELWVDFLMRESESVLAEKKDLPSAATLPSLSETINVEEEGNNSTRDLAE